MKHAAASLSGFCAVLLAAGCEVHVRRPPPVAVTVEGAPPPACRTCGGASGRIRCPSCRGSGR